MKNILFTFFLFFLITTAYAHVGSPGSQMQGQAGPYRVLVSVTPPTSIPGKAQLSIHIENEDNFRVTARYINLKTGEHLASKPKQIKRSGNKIGYFEDHVWISAQGSAGIQIFVEGSAGKGSIMVPVVAVSTGESKIPLELYLLGALLAILFIVTRNATIRRKILAQKFTSRREVQLKKGLNIAIYVVAVTMVTFAGQSWWYVRAANVNAHDYQPLTANTSILLQEELPVFQLKIDSTDRSFTKKGNILSTLIPDHGKLMHTFLIRTPGLDVFAHLHPKRIDSLTFQAALPSLPVGKYLVYSDIVSYSGFSQTLVDTLEIDVRYNTPEALSYTGIDDAYVVTDPIDAPGRIPFDDNVVICGKPGTKTVFKDGSYAVWEGKPDKALETGKTYALNFEIFNPDGSPCLPEPYMGIMGHAVVLKTDGSVYIHLHPSGSYAMAAEHVFKNRMADTTKILKNPHSKSFKDSIDQHLTTLESMTMIDREIYLMTEMGMYETNDNGMMGMDHSNQIHFPYSFPKAGRYRIYLQIKRNEKILTGVFDVKVVDPVKN